MANTNTIIPKDSQSINMNTGSGKGLEKAISTISTFVIKAQSKINKIIYGSPRADIKNKNTNKRKKRLSLLVNTLGKITIFII